ncbi:MAG: hypothetical protein AAF202_10085, partial [Pseudomonadota bacterium]
MAGEFLVFSDYSKRLHWLFLVTSGAMAVAYIFISLRAKTNATSLAASKIVSWWSEAIHSKSFWLDIKLWSLNRILRALVILPIEAAATFAILK